MTVHAEGRPFRLELLMITNIPSVHTSYKTYSTIHYSRKDVDRSGSMADWAHMVVTV